MRGNCLAPSRNCGRKIPALIMRLIKYTTVCLSLVTALAALLKLPSPFSWVIATVFAVCGTYATTTKVKIIKGKYIVRLKGFSWTREDFCRGWLITGDTGSGKTRSGINQLLHQVFQNDKNWGGLCIDD